MNQFILAGNRDVPSLGTVRQTEGGLVGVIGARNNSRMNSSIHFPGVYNGPISVSIVRKNGVTTVIANGVRLTPEVKNYVTTSTGISYDRLQKYLNGGILSFNPIVDRVVDGTFPPNPPFRNILMIRILRDCRNSIKIRSSVDEYLYRRGFPWLAHPVVYWTKKGQRSAWENRHPKVVSDIISAFDNDDPWRNAQEIISRSYDDY